MLIAITLSLLGLFLLPATAGVAANLEGDAYLGKLETRALNAPQRQTLKILHFNLSGGNTHKGTYPIIGRVVREIQERNPDVISLNEICDRQWEHLLVQLESIGYPMAGYFQESRTFVPDCIVLPDTRNEAGNAILARGTLISDQGYMFTTDHKLEMREQPVVTEERSVACLTAQFSIPNQPVKICSTHLSPKVNGAANPYAGAEAEARELARVFGPEAAAGSFILMGDMNLKPGNPALSSLYAPAAGNGQFWEVDQYYYCDDEFCDGPVQGGSPTHGEGKIDYVFVSRKHFNFDFHNVELLDAGQCSGRTCSDHKIFRSQVYLHQTITPYGTLRNAYSGKCVTVTGTANNAQAVQFTCNTTSSDYNWRFEHAWEGEYIVRKQNGGRCLRQPGFASTSVAVQTTCDPNDTMQRWHPRDPALDNLRNVGTASCMAVTNTANNAGILQNSACSTTTTQQRWTFP